MGANLHLGRILLVPLQVYVFDELGHFLGLFLKGSAMRVLLCKLGEHLERIMLKMIIIRSLFYL